LDAAFGALAAYIAASGAAYSVQMNNQTARTNIEQTLEDLTTVLGVDGTNVITNINNSANTTFNAVFQKFAAILGADGANEFLPTVQGSTRATIEAAIEALASYFSASSAAWSVQTNNQTARTNLEQTIEDITTVFGVDGTNVLTNINNSANVTYNAIAQKFAAIIGADGVNVFNPSIGGSARTTFDDAFAALGTALGAEYDGSPDLYDTVVTGYDSSAIVGNPDGSVMERLENIHDDISNFSGGLGYRGVCTSDGTATSAIVLGLGGYGNDVFNNKYYIQIIYNTSGAGTSPEPKVRKITGYTSASGTFTFATVTDAPVIGDIVLIFYESLAATGRDGTDSDFSSSNVAANENGTILERLEQIQEATNVGTGTGLPSNKSLYDIAGATYVDGGGGFGTDSINSDLGVIHTEVETVSLAAGGGSAASNAREGSLVRYIADNLVASNTYGEVIPDTYFTKAAITTAVTPPPASEAACTIVSIPAVANTEFVLRGLWINTTSFGTGTQITYELWVSINGTPTSVDSVIVNVTGWQNLMDLFALQEVNSASIYVTAITNVGNTGAASGTYHYASAI
jgi:hypothetical protein